MFQLAAATLAEPLPAMLQAAVPKRPVEFPAQRPEEFWQQPAAPARRDPPLPCFWALPLLPARPVVLQQRVAQLPRWERQPVGLQSVPLPRASSAPIRQP